MRLGVNIDHVATLRQARKASWPDPIEAAKICRRAGCHSIIAHLREDRRHINDRDVWRIKDIFKSRFNLEMSAAKEIVDIALKVKPCKVTLVPEKRREMTTEGGLDLLKNEKKVSSVVDKMRQKGIRVSLFINPDKKQINAAKRMQAYMVELHTGFYSDAENAEVRKNELMKIKYAASYARFLGLAVSAGHGLDYKNVKDIAKIEDIEELNIGYSIVSRSIFVGIKKAVKEMLALVK